MGCIASLVARLRPLYLFRVLEPSPVRRGLGFRVQGLGFRVQGLGLRVQGLGFRVWGFTIPS